MPSTLSKGFVTHSTRTPLAASIIAATTCTRSFSFDGSGFISSITPRITIRVAPTSIPSNLVL
jgi:hypothetical protein